MKKNLNYSNAIYKSNRLIESCYNLTTTQNRILYLAMTKLETRILSKNLNIKTVEDQINRSNFDLIDIPVAFYKEVFNIKSNNLYSELEKIATELYESEIIYIKENGDIGRKRWVITCEYNNQQKGVSLQFHPDLIKDLLVFKSEYTKMIFDEFANKVKRKHSFRIYELCKQYTKYGYRDFYVEEFRFKLSLNDNEYKSFSDFKKYVIDPSIKEINENTDLKLKYKVLLKEKRKIKKFRLEIKQNDSKQLNLFENSNKEIKNIEDIQIVDQISQIAGIEIKAGEAKQILTVALTAIDSIDELKEKNIGVKDYINEKVLIVKNYINNTSKRNINFIGALINSLKYNWNNSIVNPETSKISFNNFTQRNYDYDYLEDVFINGEDYDENKLYKK